MKKTKLLVMTAAIVFGVGTSVYAALPANSIVVGTDVYDSSYFTNDTSGTNTAKVNDQLANNLGNIYYVDSSGVTKDIFTESTITDSQIISRVGNTLTYHPGNGTTEKIVADANNNFLTPTMANGGYAIAHVTYKQLTGGLYLFTCQLSQLSGVTGAAYFQAGSSPMTSLTDSATYMGQLSTGASSMIHLYASDGVTELANGYLNIVTNGNTSGDMNLTVNLTLTGNSTNTDSSTQGNTAYNIVNNGFATIDKNGKWIYYSNTGDGNKLYRKSVSGTDDFPISNDSVKYINVVGDWVYYSNYNDGGKIYKVQTDGTERQKVSNDMASCINVVGDSIYYINHSDKDRIYVQDSDGRKMVLSDQAKYLSVTGNFLFYVNAGDSNRLYSYDLRNNRKAEISTVNTKFINACNDYLVFYTGYDGVLYRSTNAQGQLPVPMTVTTNVAQKSSKTSAYKSLTDRPTIICATDDNNIYYISYVDGNKIYKLDNTGNGYKVVNDSANYMNIIGDKLYYMKAGKVYIADKDGDGTQAGVAVTKLKLTNKVVSVNPIPTFTTDDITKFNFPETVSCIMSDGSEQTLVVSWNKTVPKPTKGVYTFKGTILGYGTAVSMNVSLGSGTINANNVKIVNNVGSKDTISISGLTAGDVINVYNNSTDTKALKSATVDANGNVNMTGLNLSADGGSVYITLTKTGRVEGDKVGVQYQAEAPVGFAVDAANQNVTGLTSGKSYKVYIQDENSDGTVPALPSSYDVSGEADSNGNLNVPDMISKIDGNADEKQMLRVVAAGAVDSAPSSPVEVSRASVPSYVAIDLNLGRITGTTTGMEFTYDDPTSSTATWYPCQAGSTPISMTRSLKVSVKVLANGPVLESKSESYGLFPVPVITGITDGGTYTPGNSSDTKFSSVTWSADSDNVKYTAKLTKPDGTTVDIGRPSDTNKDLVNDTTANGSYVLTVTGTKTVSGMGSATNSTTVKFTVSSAVPSPVDISMIEIGGTAASNKVDTYYQATPTWVDLAGTVASTVIQRVDTYTPPSASATDTAWDNAAKVAFVKGSTIQQDGYYKLTVTSTSKENGATNVSTKVFRVDTQDKATSPTVSGVSDGAIYNGDSDITKNGITINDVANNSTKATIMRDGYKTDYVSRKEITVNGNYVLTLDTTNTINGATVEKTISFKMDNTDTNPTQPVKPAPTGAQFTFNADGTAQITGVDTSEEYSVNNGQSWTAVTSSGTQLITSTNELNLLNSAATTNVEVRYRANGSVPASDPELIPLTKAPSAPTLTFSFGEYDSNNKLIGKLSGTAQYSIDGGLTWKDVDSNGNLQSGDADKINTTNGVQVRLKATGTSDASTTSTSTTGATKASNVETISIAQAAAPTVTSTVVSGEVKLTSPSTGLEYRINTGNTKGTWGDFTSSGTTVTPTQAGSIDIRSKATGTAMPGYVTTITVQAAPTAAIDYNNEQITGVNGNSMEWSTDGSKWNTFSGSTIDLNSNKLVPDSTSTTDQDVYITYTPTATSVGLTQHLTVKSRQQTIDSTKISSSIVTSTGVITIAGLNPSTVNAYDVETSTDSGNTWSSSSTAITSTDASGVGTINASSTVNAIRIRLKPILTASASEYSGTITVTAASKAATGTITFGTPVNGNTVTVGGTKFTKADSKTDSTNFVTADDLVADINTLSNVSATNSGGTITITAKTPGTTGNSITLSSTGVITVSGSTLKGGQ